MTFDEDDKVMSKTRNEMLIIQRIGNIVAHQTDIIRYYQEGFVVNKTYIPAQFTAVIGISSKGIAAISDDEIKKRKKKSKLFIGRDVDWEKNMRITKKLVIWVKNLLINMK